MNAVDEPNVMSAGNHIMANSRTYTRTRIFRVKCPVKSSAMAFPYYEDIEAITGGQDTFDLTYMNWKPSMK